MPEHDNAELACRVIRAWNTRDFPGYRALLSEACVEEIGDAGPAQRAAGEVLQRNLSNIPDLWFEIADVSTTEDMAVVSWRARGTMWSDRSPAGTIRRPIEVIGFTAIGVRAGRIARLWHSWDMADAATEPAAQSLTRD